MRQSDKLTKFRDKLHTLRAHLDAQLSPVADKATELADSGDRAALQSEITVNIGLAKHEAVLRQEIDDALRRIDAGTFGQCEKCHGAINAHRLDAIPHARFCVQCERQIEQLGS